MENALIKTEGGRRRAVPLATIRIATHIGDGTVRYLTEDGWVGVHLDGDPDGRVDEIRLSHLDQAQRAEIVAVAA
jgi:hypothetical protein